MAEIKVGDRVRIKDRPDWPKPPGYRLANAEGVVTKWVEYDEVMEEFQEYVYVRLEKAEGEAKVYIGNEMFFPAGNLEKI
jgi:hypothetical protein